MLAARIGGNNEGGEEFLDFENASVLKWQPTRFLDMLYVEFESEEMELTLTEIGKIPVK